MKFFKIASLFLLLATIGVLATPTDDAGVDRAVKRSNASTELQPLENLLGTFHDLLALFNYVLERYPPIAKEKEQDPLLVAIGKVLDAILPGLGSLVVGLLALLLAVIEAIIDTKTHAFTPKPS